MNNYVKKQTSITPDELVNGESLSVDGTSTEQEEEKTLKHNFIEVMQMLYLIQKKEIKKGMKLMKIKLSTIQLAMKLL